MNALTRKRVLDARQQSKYFSQVLLATDNMFL